MASPKKRRQLAKKKAARRRAGDAADLARFREGVRVRASRFTNKKKEAARRACRTNTVDD